MPTKAQLESGLRNAAAAGDDAAAKKFANALKQGRFDDVSVAPIAPVAAQELSGADYASGLAGQIAQGATASFGDELVGGMTAGMAHLADVVGIDAVPEGDTLTDTYTKIRDNIRIRNKQFRDENPVTALAANIAGGIVPVGTAFKAAKGVKGAAQMAGVGAGWGLADYLGEVQQFDDVEVIEAIKRAGMSAAIPAILSGGKGAMHWLRNREQDEVAAVLSELKGMTNKTAAEIQEQSGKLGSQASLVDVTGDVGIGFGQGVRGVGAMDVAETMQKNLSKVNQAKNRIRTVLKTVTGKGENKYYDDLDELRTVRKANAEKLYGKAMNEGSVAPTKRMLNIMNTNPLVRESWENVQNQYARNDRALPELFEQTVDGKIIGKMVDGKLVGTGKKFPNMRAVQALKWEMDAQIALRRGAVDARGKSELRQLLNDKKEFLDDVYKQNPAFKVANEKFSGDVAMESAQEMGKKRGLGIGNVDDQLREIGQLTKSERQAYLSGLMSNVYSKLGSTPDELLGNINAMASKNSQKVLTKLVGSKGAKRVMQEIKSQKRFKEVEQKINQGSQTAPRQAAIESLEKRNQQLNIQDIKKASIANNVLQKAAQMLPNKFGKLTPVQLNELADLMTKEGGVPLALQRMEQAGLNAFELDAITKMLSAAGIASYASGE